MSSGFLAVSLAVVHAAKWVDIPERWQTTGELVNASSISRFDESGCSPASNCDLVAIQTGPVSNTTRLEALVENEVTEELRFTLRDDVVGKKTRLEATACFVTAADLRRHGLDPNGTESRQLQDLHFVYQNCSGAATAPSAAIPTEQNVSYAMLLPTDFSPTSQAILGQFHGRPDPRHFFDPKTNATRTLSTAEAHAACFGAGGEAWCKEGVVQGGPLDGQRYKQGGYPPLTFGFSSSGGANETAQQFFYAFGRSDDRLFIPKGDCSFNPARSYWPDGRACPGGEHEQVHGIWRAPFGELPLGRWLRFSWRIVWSAYAVGGGALLTNGSVALRIADERGGAPLAEVQWRGPLGRHDDGRAPFFKIGVYNPSGDGQPVQVSYKDFRQSTRVLTAAA